MIMMLARMNSVGMSSKTKPSDICYNASLSDHSIMEEDHIPSLKSHGPRSKTVVSWCPDNLLLFIIVSPKGRPVCFATGPFTIRHLMSDVGTRRLQQKMQEV